MNQIIFIAQKAIEACGTVAQDVPTVEQQSQLVAHL
jgi:hypothetical protein